MAVQGDDRSPKTVGQRLDIMYRNGAQVATLVELDKIERGCTHKAGMDRWRVRTSLANMAEQARTLIEEGVELDPAFCLEGLSSLLDELRRAEDEVRWDVVEDFAFGYLPAIVSHMRPLYYGGLDVFAPAVGGGEGQEV